MCLVEFQNTNDEADDDAYDGDREESIFPARLSCDFSLSLSFQHKSTSMKVPSGLAYKICHATVASDTHYYQFSLS